MNQVGLDGRMATKALGEIEKTYTEVYIAHGKIQDSFIRQIGRTWFGNDAVDLVVKKAVPAILQIYDEVERVYQSVNDTITQNAKNFEAKHETNVFTPVPHSRKNITYDCSLVRSDDRGFIGLKNTEGLKLAISGIRHYTLTMDYQLNVAKAAAAKSGFFGEGQQEKLDASMKKIQNNVKEIGESLNNALKDKLSEVETDERRIAKTNADTF